MTSLYIQRANQNQCHHFVLFDCFSNSIFSDSRPSWVSRRRTLANRPFLFDGPSWSRPDIDWNWCGHDSRWTKEDRSKMITSGQVTFSWLQYLCFLPPDWESLITLVVEMIFNIETALYGVRKGLNYLSAVIGPWFWHPIDLNMRPLLSQVVEKGEMAQQQRYIGITISLCPFSDATYV